MAARKQGRQSPWPAHVLGLLLSTSNFGDEPLHSRDRNLPLWHAVGDFSGRSILDKRREGLLQNVWNVLTSCFTGCLWGTSPYIRIFKEGSCSSIRRVWVATDFGFHRHVNHSEASLYKLSQTLKHSLSGEQSVSQIQSKEMHLFQELLPT